MNKYWAFMRMNLINTVTYRGMLLVWLIGNLLTLVVLISIWLSASGGNKIGSFTKPELIIYYIFATLLWWIVGWHCFSYVRDIIKDGSISGQTLTKPVSLFWQTFFEELGWHLVGSPIGLITSIISISVVIKLFSFTPHFYNLGPFLISLIIATLIVFSLNLTLALFTFWLTETEGLSHIVWSGMFIFGGQGIPVSFFSGIYAQIVTILPFRYVISFPLEILFNKLSSEQTFTGFGIGIGWVLILGLLYKFLWKNGVRIYTAYGN